MCTYPRVNTCWRVEIFFRENVYFPAIFSLSVIFHIHTRVMILQVNSICVYKIGVTHIGMWSSFTYIESVYPSISTLER